MSWRCASGIELMQPLDRGHALGNLAGRVLRKVSDRDLVSPADLAVVDIARRGGLAWRVSEQRPQERRLADAVAADEHDLLAAIDHGGEVRDDGEIAVALADASHFEHGAA